MASPSVLQAPSPEGKQKRSYRSYRLLWPAGAVLLVGTVYLFASWVQRWGLADARFLTLGAALVDPLWRNIAEWIAIALCATAALTYARELARRFKQLERAFDRFARQRTRAILFTCALPLLLRLAVLPALGIPEPRVADEFGYLLLADTFASGRLTNPTHSFWQHFETIYVFHQPSYNAIYPIAPAALLTVAKLLGVNPWFGVWFGAGLMCGLICWMLQGWVPPKWALLGGLLAVSRFTVVSPWMNTYWGGAAAAIGGALVLGALPRIRRSQRIRDALLFALGLAILAQSRPFEGVLFALPLLASLTYWLFTTKRTSLRTRILRVAAPLAGLLVVMAAAMLWYQYRVTGDAWLPPYLLHQKLYGTPQTLYWQPPVPDAPGIHRYRDIGDVFRWQFEAHRAGFSWAAEQIRLGSFWQFYLQPLLAFPLLMLPLVLRRKGLWMVLGAGVLLLAGNAAYPFFFAHYAAPLCGMLILLIVQGMRYIRATRFRSKPVGAAMLGGLLIAIGASASTAVTGGLLGPWFVSATNTPRGVALKQLQELGGKHLVFVRYSPHHSFHYGTIFNDANLETAPVLWAHQLDPASDKALAKHYTDRDVWFFNPDELPVTLVPFTDKAYISGIAPGAGRRDDVNQGVSPGSIAVLLGGNLTKASPLAEYRYPLSRLPVRILSVSAELGEVFAPAESNGENQPPIAFARNGISVNFKTIPAPILAVSKLEGQESVTIQVPFELSPGETVVTLRDGDMVSSRRVNILPATPGIFQMRHSDGAYRGIVTREDGSLIDLQHPAHPDETLHMFTTGLGPMLPPVRTSEPGSRDVISSPVRKLIVGVNHHGAPLISARYAEGMIGVVDVTFQTPPEVPTGSDVPLSVGVVIAGRTIYSNKSSLPVGR